ncbi:MAG: tRNA 2-thiouridine(34) synthase MnmA [Deltaproteobacteria bacterium]|nr:tRNA 2-thiouridine(34) synthase MnmA [Deltaproteobacteria bacterium]
MRVVVAMSGGVDSSVAALLLKLEGHDVIGISLKLWDEDNNGGDRTKTCCSLSDVRDARNVCDRLGIPFYVFNHKKDFERQVILPFVAEYHRGRTPNPCILCNHHVKFDPLLAEAEKLGADYLATGHYARIHRDSDGSSRLLKARDEKKDQSYVLYHLGQERLKKILFPLGDHTKEEVRKIALEHGLPNALKPDSQEICFVPNNDHASFIEKNYPAKDSGAGNFVDREGNILGRHEGIHHYTVGQRRGLGIGLGERMYVTRIDSVKNEVELGPKDETFRNGLVAEDVHWVRHPFKNGNSFECGVKTRYQKDEWEAVIEPLVSPSPQPSPLKGEGVSKEIPSPLGGEGQGEGCRVIVRFKNKSPFVSPGQAAVFYHGDEVIGGGWIERAL